MLPAGERAPPGGERPDITNCERGVQRHVAEDKASFDLQLYEEKEHLRFKFQL